MHSYIAALPVSMRCKANASGLSRVQITKGLMTLVWCADASQAPTPAASSSGQTQTDSAPQDLPIPTPANAGAAAKTIKDKITKLLTRLFSQSPQSTQTALFSLHVTLIVLALMHLQPLHRKLSRMGWIYFLQTSLVSHAFKVSWSTDVYTCTCSCSTGCKQHCPFARFQNMSQSRPFAHQQPTAHVCPCTQVPTDADLCIDEKRWARHWQETIFFLGY